MSPMFESPPQPLTINYLLFREGLSVNSNLFPYLKFPYPIMPIQVLEKVIQKESEHMVKARCRFPVLRASRLRELMDENKHLQKMDKAELDQVTQ